MANKPELSVPQQTQAPGMRNVVVYVGNDNLAHAYATAEHLNPQQQLHPNVPYDDNNINHHIQNKHILKSEDVQQSHPTNFYHAPDNFPTHEYHPPPNHPSAVLTQCNYNSGVKNIISYNSGGGGEVYSAPGANVRVQGAKRDDVAVSTASGYVITTNDNGNGTFVTVMGAEVGREIATDGVINFPRCDSVRSETAESSCSSLSSGDCLSGDSSHAQHVGQPGLVLLPPTGVPPTQPPNNDNNVTLVYDNNGVTAVGGVRGPPLIVAMTPSEVVCQPQPQSPDKIPNAMNVPLGWKRITTNNSIIYVR